MFAIEPYDGTGPALGGSLGLRVNRVEAEPAEIVLNMGETFSLRDLVVHAWGRSKVTRGSHPAEYSEQPACQDLAS